MKRRQLTVDRALGMPDRSPGTPGIAPAIAMEDLEIDCFEQAGGRAAEIGDLDLKRNLKLRAFVGLVLTPVFRDLQLRLRYAEMGKRGVTAMQYYADFENSPAPFGYGDDFTGRYEIRLCRSASEEHRAPEGGVKRVERLIVETRATLTGRQAVGALASLGFEPDLGAPAGRLRRRARTGLTEDAVRRFFLDHGAPYMHPRRVYFLDEMPLTPAKKVDRSALKMAAGTDVARDTHVSSAAAVPRPQS
jgi:hypothetical protein